MGLLAVQISGPSLIQFEYLRLQLYINNVGQGQTGKRQNSPLFSFINGIKTKYLLYTIDKTEYHDTTTTPLTDPPATSPS